MPAELGPILHFSESSHELLADLFHALNQPLAALRCSCELALHAPRSAERYRECLQTALEKAEQASSLAKGIRELLEAAEEQASPKTNQSGAAGLSFPEQVREAVEYFSSPAAEAGTTLQLDCDNLSEGECRVNFCPDGLRRALFYIFDCVLPLAAGKKVTIQWSTTALHVFLHIAFPHANGAASNADRDSFIGQATHGQQKQWQTKLHWAIAERLFFANHGSLMTTLRGGELRVQACLPLARPVARVSSQQ